MDHTYTDEISSQRGVSIHLTLQRRISFFIVRLRLEAYPAIQPMSELRQKLQSTHKNCSVARSVDGVVTEGTAVDVETGVDPRDLRELLARAWPDADAERQALVARLRDRDGVEVERGDEALVRRRRRQVDLGDLPRALHVPEEEEGRGELCKRDGGVHATDIRLGRKAADVRDGEVAGIGRGGAAGRDGTGRGSGRGLDGQGEERGDDSGGGEEHSRR